MTIGKIRAAASLSLAILLVGCASPPAPAGPRSSGGEAPASGAPAAVKRITAAIQGDPFTLNSQVNTAGGNTQPGIPEVEQLVHAGLAIADSQGLRPQLAEVVPTIENRNWRLFPDGRMETTWRIRERAVWHDGTPFTTGDLLFTLQVVQDRELVAFRHRTYDFIEGVEAPDGRTLTLKWRRPFIGADAMFSGTSERLAVPLPKHLLEPAYTSEKATFLELPYWTEQFIGAGPFRLRSWVRESHLVLEAYDQYVLGRPKVDEIEVRFIPDPNALMAHVLAGTVELTTGRGLSIEQAVEVRDQWRAGRLETGPARWVVIFPQLLTPNPPLVADVQFRRALVHAIDRQDIADTLQKGVTTVAHSFLEPNQAQYREIEERYVVRYDHDSRRATQLLEGLGYARGPDGALRDAANQRLSFEARTPNIGPNEKLLLAVVDHWQRIGLAPEPVVIPRQRFGDNEYRWTFPGFELTKRPHDVKGLANLHSSQTPLPENRFLGSNVSRYTNPEFDALLDKYFATIPKAERIQALGQIIHHLSDRVILLGLVYDPEPTLIGNRLRGVGPPPTLDAVQTWNAEQWDIG